MMKATDEQQAMAAAMGQTSCGGSERIPPANELTMANAAEWFLKVAKRQQKAFESLRKDRDELRALQSDIEAFRRIIGTAR